jgi:CHAT domain-containing protein
VLAVLVWSAVGRVRHDRPELNDLISALALQGTRPVQGRLAGGFPYAPARSADRGDEGRPASADVTIAAARIEKIAAQNDSATNLAALGVAYLVIGRLDPAIEALSDATRIAADARYQSDLSAAYLARAASKGPAEDLAQALAAADRAIARNSVRSEPYFNRALALEGLHLIDEAKDAWATYGAHDSSPAWNRESLTHAVALRDRQRFGRQSEPDRQAEDHQAIRERIEDDLLTNWGASIDAGEVEQGDRFLSEALMLAERLADSGGDAMPRDEAYRIRRAQAARDRQTVRELAIGHRLYGAARRSYVADHQQQASEVMKEAARHFTLARSPYALWAPIFRAISLRNSGQARSALDALQPLSAQILPESYYNIRGRLWWTEGVAMDALGRFDLGRRQLSRAVDAFQHAGEADNLIATRTILAEAEWFLGEQASAWSDIVGVLEQVEAQGSRRNYHLLLAATMAFGTHLPEVALEFQNALVRQAPSPRSKAEALIDRARTLARLGNNVAAADDLHRADGLVITFTDRGLKERYRADVMMARAEVLSHTDARRALEEANAALEYVHRADPAIRLATLLALRATCKETLNDRAGARTDLLAAIVAFEQKRKLLLSERDRVEAFQQERSTFKQLVRLEIETDDGGTEALRMAERGRSRTLLENWDELGGRPADPTQASRDLAPDVAVIYYEILADRLLCWVLTKERTVTFSRPIAPSQLEAAIARIRRVVQTGGDLESVKLHAVDFCRDVLRPALEGARGKTTLIFVPDGPLFGVPFSAMPSDDGAPLVAKYNIGMAPSLTAYLAASARLARADFDSVLAIGDGYKPGVSRLPALPLANKEATSVGDLYPRGVVLVGEAATKRRILREYAAVIHFAGHTLVNLQHPMLSRLILAPDPQQEDSDGLLMSDITRDRFGSVRLVVLATCDGAVGRFAEGEGVISVARAFFAAGVPAVVASLWPAEDNATDLLIAFHRELRARHEVTSALRAAQLSWLRNHTRTPVRTWAGFVALGGTATFH